MRKHKNLPITPSFFFLSFFQSWHKNQCKVCLFLPVIGILHTVSCVVKLQGYYYHFVNSQIYQFLFCALNVYLCSLHLSIKKIPNLSPSYILCQGKWKNNINVITKTTYLVELAMFFQLLVTSLYGHQSRRENNPNNPIAQTC